MVHLLCRNTPHAMSIMATWMHFLSPKTVKDLSVIRFAIDGLNLANTQTRKTPTVAMTSLSVRRANLLQWQCFVPEIWLSTSSEQGIVLMTSVASQLEDVIQTPTNPSHIPPFYNMQTLWIYFVHSVYVVERISRIYLDSLPHLKLQWRIRCWQKS